MANRSDDFGSASAGLNGRTPSDAGSAWVSSSVIVTASGQAKSDYANYSPDLAYLDTGVSSGDAVATLAATGQSAGPAARISNTSNGIIAYANAGGIALYKISGGALAQLGSTWSGTVNAGDVIKLSYNAANEWRVYQNGTLRLGPITDSFNSTATGAGIGFYSSGVAARLDNLAFTAAGAGTTQVTSDLSASYAIRGSASPDLSATYSLRGSVQSSLVATYTLVSAVQSSISAAYSILGAVTSSLSAAYSVAGRITSDLTGAYSVGGAVQSNLSASYAIRGSASSDLSAAYSLRGAVQSDLTATYTLVSAVQSSLSAAYTVLGSASADLTASYALRGSVTRDLSANYSIQAAGVVTSDLSAAYMLSSAVTKDLGASYSLQAPVLSDLTAAYVLRSAVTGDLSVGYAILAAVTRDLAAAYTVAGPVTSDLTASYAIGSVVTRDLIASYSIYAASGGPGASAQEIADAVWQRVIEGGLTAEQVLRVIMAPLAGKADGIGTATERYYGQDGVTPRVTAEFDAQSNRTSTAVNGAP